MRKVFMLALAAAALAFGGSAASADNLQDGARAFQGGQYNRALALWRPLAVQGNPVALFSPKSYATILTHGTVQNKHRRTL